MVGELCQGGPCSVCPLQCAQDNLNVVESSDVVLNRFYDEFYCARMLIANGYNVLSAQCHICYSIDGCSVMTVDEPLLKACKTLRKIVSSS